MKANDFAKAAFSWEGEDLLVNKISLDVLGISKGTYVDVGAHHPFILSNTCLLYQRGWRGVNIDAMPGSMKLFQEFRPEDINIEIGIARSAGRLRFTMFNDPGLNGFLTDDQIAAQLRRGILMTGQREIECQSLATVLAQHEINSIDLLTIDAEGLDEDVLLSHDFTRCRPKLILTEILGCSDMASVQNTSIVRLLTTMGFTLFSRLHFSALFMDRNLLM